MKRICIMMLALVAYLAVAVPLFAAPDKEQLAAEYLELSKTKETFDITIQTYVDQLGSENAMLDKDKLRDYFQAYMGWEVLKKPTTKLVADSFSAEELIAINNFYKSAAGKAFADKSPAISAAISRLIGNNLSKATGKLPQL